MEAFAEKENHPSNSVMNIELSLTTNKPLDKTMSTSDLITYLYFLFRLSFL